MSSRSAIALTIFVTAAALAFSLVPAFAGVTETTPITNAVDDDFAAGKIAIDAKHWTAAIIAFNKVIARQPKNADAHNLLGHAYRWNGNMDDSFRHYREALKLDPNHRGAHEYLGVAYQKVNQPARAMEHLLALEKICSKKCEEYEELSKAIAAYQPAAPAAAK